jgi:hypothetical protein
VMGIEHLSILPCHPICEDHPIRQWYGFSSHDMTLHTPPRRQ